MNTRYLALGVLAIVAAAPAAAFAGVVTLYDSYTGNTPVEYTGYQAGGASLVAQEFAASSSNFNSLSLALSVDNPSDGGSVMVYLIPDSNAWQTGDGSIPVDAVTIGTYADSRFSPTANGAPGLTQITTNQTLSVGDQYWIAVQGSATSTFEWWVGSNQPGIGTANQLSGDNGDGGWGVYDIGTQYSLGQYSMIIDMPEPGTIAILGLGLAGLGLARRRPAA